MATEKRLIDANALMDSFRSHMVKSYDRNKCTLEENCKTCEPGCLWRKKVSEAPTVDAVEVVRCKDCKHYMAEEKERCEALRSTPYGLCLKHRCLPLAGYHEYRNADDFCSYGEMKDNETG
jgi:hypothetical protein